MAKLVWLKSKHVENSYVFRSISEKHGVEDGEGKKQKQQRGRIRKEAFESSTRGSIAKTSNRQSDAS